MIVPGSLHLYPYAREHDGSMSCIIAIAAESPRTDVYDGMQRTVYMTPRIPPGHINALDTAWFECALREWIAP